MSYNPLPSNLELKESKIHGVGLFVKEDLNSDIFHNILCETHIYLNECDRLFRLVPGAYINHSEDPNCTLREKVVSYLSDSFIIYALFPIKNLKKGEELTINYKHAIKHVKGVKEYTNEEWL